MHGTRALGRANTDDPAVILGAVVLQRGGLVAFPTETVYGLGANALDPLAVSGIFAAKGRPAADPLIVHIAHRGQLSLVTRELPVGARALADAFWPGPLTLILPKSSRVPDLVTAGLDTVAVRIPAHPAARALLRASNLPIAAPSANRFSRPSPTTAAHVEEDLGDVVDLILDGGPCPVGIESTIVAFEGGQARILRPGGISREAIEAVLGPVAYESFVSQGVDTPARSPGTLLRHYAPQAPLHLVDGPASAALAWIRARAERARAGGLAVGLLLFEGDELEVSGAQIVRLRRGDAAAQDLYGALRRLDGLKVEVSFGRMPQAEGLGLGLRDRLYRAAEGRVEGAGG